MVGVGEVVELASLLASINLSFLVRVHRIITNERVFQASRFPSVSTDIEVVSALIRWSSSRQSSPETNFSHPMSSWIFS